MQERRSTELRNSLPVGPAFVGLLRLADMNEYMPTLDLKGRDAESTF